MNNSSQIRSRKLERLSLFLVTVMLCLGFFTLNNNLEKQLNNAEEGYKNGFVLSLNKGVDPKKIAILLIDRNYIADKKDAQHIANHIAKKLETELLPNLGALNLRAFSMNADSAYLFGGTGLKARVQGSREILGLNEYIPVANFNGQISDSFSANSGENIAINVQVMQRNESAGWLKKHLHKDMRPISAVVVQLKAHYYDSLLVAQDSVLGYAITNSSGKATFNGLRGNGHYSVIPIRKGYEYGSSKGTARGTLSGMNQSERTFTFNQHLHQLSPFDGLTYSQLKEDAVLTVRTPQQYLNELLPGFVFFLLAWWFLHFYFNFRRKDIDQLLAPVLMALSGIGLLTMYSIANPLTDKMLGTEMAIGAVVGVILLAIISEINFITLFNSNYNFKFDFVLSFLTWLAKPFSQKMQEIKVKGKLTLANTLLFYVQTLIFLLFLPIELLFRIILFVYKKLPVKLQIVKLSEGVGYLLLALFLAGMLIPFGDGPEGSGVKVNLFFFQPSEITKYLIVFFLAAFFVLNNRADKIQKFSEKFSWIAFKLQIKTVIVILIGLLILLAFYLYLGDMGPALVLAISFIIIYSVVRKDFHYLVIGVATFVVLLYFAYTIGGGSQFVIAAFTLIWLFCWLLFGYLKPNKQLYESAIFLNIVIAAFIFGSNLPKVGQRLQDRNEIYANVWNNEVTGGDQVVQGLWSLSSGGLSGQGLGKGSPNLVPAFHTDMVFTSMGEELGWIGLLLIVLCMAILLHRTLLIGRKTGHSFLYYLATGIAVVTGVQFLVITLGSLGLIPLTGIAVPFLSYGKTSLIINLAAFGVIFSISKISAGKLQESRKKEYRDMVSYSSFTYTIVSLIILATLFWYQFVAQNSILIRPAYMSNRQGARIVEYNPRINLLVKKLYAGNIYDRNGLILATNDKSLLEDKNNKQKITTAGIDESDLNDEMQKHKIRLYPFGDNLFFMLGDYNTTILWNDADNNPHGYNAEHRHLAALRGFDNLKYDEDSAIKRINLISHRYKASPFINPIEKDYRYTDYDYSALLTMLKDGIEGEKVKRWNKKREERDITLTVDAALQTDIQNELSSYVAKNFNGEEWNKLRVSVVVLDAQRGDLLCSANYPLPNQRILRDAPFVYNEKNKHEKAYTDRDLGLTFQTAPGSTAKVMSAMSGLQRLGPQAAAKTYYVDLRESIEGTKEPHNKDVTMEEAIVKSSNCYFINLINDQNLYSQLDSIYSVVGIRIDQHNANKIKKDKTTLSYKSLTPYYLNYQPSEKEFKSVIKSEGREAVKLYRDYITKRENYKTYERMTGYSTGHDWNKLAWAWGQGTLRATPLNMARIASIVVNQGEFMPTQYILKSNKNLRIPESKPIKMLDRNNAEILRQYMTKESMEEQPKRNEVFFTHNIGGKTGTPERELRYIIYDANGNPRLNKKGHYITENLKPNDGWYIFFTNSDKPIAVAIRMERLFDSGSGAAVRLNDKVVINALEKAGYF